MYTSSLGISIILYREEKDRETDNDDKFIYVENSWKVARQIDYILFNNLLESDSKFWINIKC